MNVISVYKHKKIHKTAHIELYTDIIIRVHVPCTALISLAINVFRAYYIIMYALNRIQFGQLWKWLLHVYASIDFQTI